MNSFRKDDDDNDYVFQSGAGLAYFLYESPKNIFNSNAVSFEEVVKIVESPQYLNP